MVSYSFKKRFVDPIRYGLGTLPADVLIRNPISRGKLQTIRAEGKRRHARPGETLQLYTVMRTKQCAKIGDARCVRVRSIRIRFGGDFDVIEIAGEEPFGGKASDIHKLDEFSYRDGFRSWDAMLKFWEEEHPGVTDFRGFLIEWEPL
jgi:hypothetical protein